MCAVFKVSRGGFYKWTLSTPSTRSVEKQIPEAEPLQAFQNSKRIYGRLVLYISVIPAFKMAQRRRPITGKLVFHSDRGVQYAFNESRCLLEKHPLIIRGMSRKGDCWDNAVAESFFKTL